MNRDWYMDQNVPARIPRASGDEPAQRFSITASIRYSPRERG